MPVPLGFPTLGLSEKVIDDLTLFSKDINIFPVLLIIMNAFGMIFVVYSYRKLGLGDVGREQVLSLDKVIKLSDARFEQ